MSSKVRNIVFGSLISAAFVSPAFSSNATITEIPVQPESFDYHRIDVNDNGTVAFSTTSDGATWSDGTRTQYKWSMEAGVTVLGQKEGSAGYPHISSDGNVVAFTSAVKGGYQDFTYVYTDTTLRVVDRLEIVAETLSSDGTVLGGAVMGTGIRRAGTLNLSNNTLTLVEDTAGNVLTRVNEFSTSSDTMLVHGVNENNQQKKLYLVSSTGESTLVGDDISMGSNQPRMSGDGQTVIYQTYDCAEQLNCLISWNKNTNEKTEQDFVKYYSVTADGRMIIGTDGYSYPYVVWNTSQGTRNLVDALDSIGLDLTDWSNFKGLTISDNGTKIAGFGINPAGQERAFLIDIIPQCPVF